MKRLRRGRPQGSKAALLKSPRRFEVAVWVAATANGMPAYQAANLAVVLIRSDGAITAAGLNESFSVASTTYYGCSLETNEDHFTRYARSVMQKASDREYEWITKSAQYLCFACGGDQISFNELAKLGWTDVLVRLAARLEPALRSNFPPFDGALRRRTRARLNLPVT